MGGGDVIYPDRRDEDEKLLTYTSEAMTNDVEITGNLRVVVWISMDVPDTDFQVCIYELQSDQSSIILTDSMLRARYRNSLSTESLVEPWEINRYEFDQFHRRCHFGSVSVLVLNRDPPEIARRDLNR